MDIRRFEIAGLAYSRLRYVIDLIRKGQWKRAYNHLWVALFTRDAGIALQDTIYRFVPFIRPYPEAIEVEVTTRCHLRCTMCEHTYWKEPSRDMSFDEFKRVIDQFPKLKWIGTTGIGSAFLNKDFVKMLRFLKGKDMFVELYDSFDLVDERIAEEIVDMGLDKIWISLDGATQEAYGQIRVGTSLAKVLKNLTTLMDIKERKRSPFPEVWFQVIVSKPNIKEMPQIVELVHSLIRGRRYNYATLIFWTNILCFEEVRKMGTSIPDGIRKEVTELARRYHMYTTWNENVLPTHSPSYCARWNAPFVLATGHIQPCCVINNANQRDHQKKYSFVNLFHDDFGAYWRSKEFRAFLKTLRSDRFPAICTYCRAYIPK